MVLNSSLTMSDSSERPVTRQEILELMKQRDEVDETIQALGQILRSNNIGMTESLVDAEGYPRNDIDVYQVRHARHKIICLQNDFKQLTKDIDAKLAVLHQTRRDSGSSETPMDVESEEQAERRKLPIARVNLVSDGSPAYHAGLQIDDLIVKFGSLDYENFQSINDIGAIVQRSRGSVVSVVVKRQGVFMKLALIPGEWTGRGLLGCNIVPIEGIDR